MGNKRAPPFRQSSAFSIDSRYSVIAIVLSPTRAENHVGRNSMRASHPHGDTSGPAHHRAGRRWHDRRICSVKSLVAGDTSSASRCQKRKRQTKKYACLYFLPNALAQQNEPASTRDITTYEKYADARDGIERSVWTQRCAPSHNRTSEEHSIYEMSFCFPENRTETAGKL